MVYGKILRRRVIEFFFFVSDLGVGVEVKLIKFADVNNLGERMIIFF